ncbi:hypothetical protein ANN_04828 [Periplaneta americana]|uniref:DUF4371 domain-containing protein n=1 Tax=Periplaneta americana TaxID=6978 RepID=A0ABQ8TB68_PERAM|nr:hypothetical protein ANN_04828 [Periplaneta americana]
MCGLMKIPMQLKKQGISTDSQSTYGQAFLADETTDITCKSQFVINLRYIKSCKPVERFLSFKEVNNRTANGLSEVLIQSLQPFNSENKLIAQAYDGAAVNTKASCYGNWTALLIQIAGVLWRGIGRPPLVRVSVRPSPAFTTPSAVQLDDNPILMPNICDIKIVVNRLSGSIIQLLRFVAFSVASGSDPWQYLCGSDPQSEAVVGVQNRGAAVSRRPTLSQQVVQLVQVGERRDVIRLQAQRLAIAAGCLHELAVQVQHGSEIQECHKQGSSCGPKGKHQEELNLATVVAKELDHLDLSTFPRMFDGDVRGRQVKNVRVRHHVGITYADVVPVTNLH